MKRLYILLFALILFSFENDYPQNEPATCGTITSNAALAKVMTYSNPGGIYIPSTGVLKVLVVFARFKDDTDAHNWWPVGGNPQGWDTFIDPNTTTGSTNFLNLTNYYKTMSHNTYHVIGQALTVPHWLYRKVS